MEKPKICDIMNAGLIIFGKKLIKQKGEA